jgi:alpha-L-fucosidase 2
VVIHGGTWSSGSRVAFVGQILEVLTRAGHNWFSVDYRVGGLARYEDALADVRSSLFFIRCRAKELGVDPDQLVLLGEDSGASLAALLAAERPAGVIGAVLLGGLYDRPSPLTQIAGRMPDLLVVHGGADNEAPIEQARGYCDRALQSGGRCRFVEEKGASHRVENWWPGQWGYKRELADWLSALTPGSFAHRPRDGVVRKDILYSPSAQLTLDAFVPRTDKAVAAVIVVHGGGWEAGDKVTYVTPLFETLARAGLAWFSIDYRLTPAFTNQDQIEDVRQAIRFVRAEHARFNVDPARIMLLGESASGQIVMQVAAEDPSIAGVVSFYGVYDFPSMVTDASPRSLLVRLFRRTVLDDDSRGVLRKYSPLYSARTGMPPVLLVNGTAERLWSQAQAFSRRLSEIGVPHEIVSLEGAPHGLENWEGHPEWMFYKQRMVEWIRRIVSR